jgi:hypothetical protein
MAASTSRSCQVTGALHNHHPQAGGPEARGDRRRVRLTRGILPPELDRLAWAERLKDGREFSRAADEARRASGMQSSPELVTTIRELGGTSAAGGGVVWRQYCRLLLVGARTRYRHPRRSGSAPKGAAAEWCEHW